MSTTYQRRNGVFNFDGVSSLDYGVWIEGGGTFNAASRRFKEYTVPGRNGTLTIAEDAFNDIEHTYKAFIPESFKANIEGLRNELMARKGYCKLYDTYHPDEFYKAKFMSGLTAKPAPRGVAGQFDVKFKRDPRRFLVTGENQHTFEGSGTITNPTAFDARPLLYVIGSGGSITLGSDQSIIIDEGPTAMYIDCELMECYSGTTILNSYVKFLENDFPVLRPGDNGVLIQGGITKLVIIPRWWRL